MPVQLRILTYNIHHGEGVDGRVDYERLARVIRSANPDLVALQEVGNRTTRSAGVDQAAKLGELSGMHAIFGKAMDFQGGEFGEALLSRWPFVRTRNHPLRAGAGHEPRALLEGVISIEATDTQLRFYGTHLDHEETAERVNQARTIVAAVGNDGAGLMILCGDLNASPDSEPLAILKEQWTDATALPDLLTFPSEKPLLQLDYILFRPRQAFRVVEVRILDERVASDHLPVLAVLEITPVQREK